MRFQSAFFQLLGSGKRGSIVERTDGELYVPAVLQPVIELPGPLTVAQPVAGTADQSFGEIFNKVQNGIDIAAITTATMRLRAGLWRIFGNVIFQFTGTTNVAIASSAGLQNPDTTVNLVTIASVRHISPISLVVPFNIVLHTLVDGVALFIATPATVALDLLHVNVTYQANRLLI